jgi:hypothetical protein
MTLLEKIYIQLKSAQLASNAQTFSIQYLAKNKNWYSYQTHMGRDITLGAAVQCARVLRSLVAHNATLTATQNGVISATLQAIEQHLAERYMVTALADAAVN